MPSATSSASETPTTATGVGRSSRVPSPSCPVRRIKVECRPRRRTHPRHGQTKASHWPAIRRRIERYSGSTHRPIQKHSALARVGAQLLELRILAARRLRDGVLPLRPAGSGLEHITADCSTTPKTEIELRFIAEGKDRTPLVRAGTMPARVTAARYSRGTALAHGALLRHHVRLAHDPTVKTEADQAGPCPRTECTSQRGIKDASSMRHGRRPNARQHGPCHTED